MEYYNYNAQKILFEDNKGDMKVEASKLRRMACLNFFSSLKLHKDNRFTCELLKHDLDAYSKIVDNPDGVNNYVSDVLEALPSNLPSNQNKWKSSITEEMVAELLTPLPCAKDKSGWEKLNCVNAKPTAEQVRLLQRPPQQFDNCPEPYEERRKVPLATPMHSLEEKRKIVPSAPIEPKPSTSRMQPKFSFGRKTADKPTATVEHPTEANPNKMNAFKTAGEELRIQNVKKYGKDAGGNRENQLNYGLSKKSLGGRRGGIHSKFQPPILRNDDSECDRNSRESSQNDEVIDERLKNIDPKMIEIIQNEIMDSGPKLTWDDIAGLEFAKNTIQEVVVWPMLRPDIFTGLRRPPRGILLFGPPGTGKTLIGKCIASQSGATFLSISASSLTSKWVGDGEKMVRALFAVARVNQPSVVFIDEIDSLLSQRSDTEHESSRRIKTEFLVQLDGVGTGDEDRILIIGATNRPQELDEAARRRLVKRLYIPLPEKSARAEIVRNLICKERHTLTESDIERVASLTDGYSGADMKHVCQEASLGPIRSIPPMQIRNIDTSQVRAVNISDFESALNRVKSTVSPDDLHSYLTWDKQFGCGSI